MLLGIDLGTGSAKALLLATDGSVMGEASSSYPVRAPHPGWAESEPEDWWLAVASAVRKAVGNHADRVEPGYGWNGGRHFVVATRTRGYCLQRSALGPPAKRLAAVTDDWRSRNRTI